MWRNQGIQRTGRYDLNYTKTKELLWKENHDIQKIGFEDSKGNIIVETSTENLGEFEFGDFNIKGPVIRTVKYADELVLLAVKVMCAAGNE
jgi:hypothetical protein